NWTQSREWTVLKSMFRMAMIAHLAFGRSLASSNTKRMKMEDVG
ncbi:hypothetical protein LCGC14_2617650, partial [marine sediment metagenome]